MSAICSAHQKSRTLANLVDDGAGGMKCGEGNECQTAGGGGGKRNATASWGMMEQMMWNQMGFMKRQKGPAGQICTVHFKERGLANLQDDGAGGMCCLPGSECQVGAGGDLRNQYCSTHKKKRREDVLVDDGLGGKCCSPGNECQIGVDRPDAQASGGNVMCSVHNKNRSLQSCEDDGVGGYKCAAGSECQMGGGGAGGGKSGRGKSSGMMPWQAMMMKGMSKGKGKGKANCKWCRMGQCWDH